MMRRGIIHAWLQPGVFVRHPNQPDWGLGQVQSVDGMRATVGFEHRGKMLINLAVVALEPAEPDEAR